jgi:predicted transcriptional regulator
MNAARRKKLEAAGWRVGSADDFLGLTSEESALVAIKLQLADDLKARRVKLKMTQSALAKRLNSSQSRVAKMETADRSVSIDLLVRSLLTLGASRGDVARSIAADMQKAGASRKSLRRSQTTLTAS